MNTKVFVSGEKEGLEILSESALRFSISHHTKHGYGVPSDAHHCHRAPEEQYRDHDRHCSLCIAQHLLKHTKENHKFITVTTIQE